MTIEGRKSIHDNTSQTNKRNTPANQTSQEHLPDNTSFENDESQQSNSESEVTNNSPKPTPRLKTQSPSPTGRKGLVVQETLLTWNVNRSCSTKTNFETRQQTTTKRKEERVSTEENPNKRTYYILFIIAVVVAVIALCNKASVVDSSVKQCNFSSLRVKYKNEDNYLWKHLTSGIENILNDRSNKPAVYLLVHSGGEVAKELIKDIAKTSSTCFDSSMKPVEIETVDFTSKEAVSDYGYVIEKYKQKIQEGNVILIANLNEIPAETANALHAICDTHSPIVPKVIIFLSLMADNKGERAVDTAQEALRELWEPTISLNKLDPLIARVTDEVILLQSK